MNCLVIICWRNHCSHILCRQIDILIEMRIDDSVMYKIREGAVAYKLDVAEAFVTTQDNVYAVQNEDGSYDIYFKARY